MKLRCLVMLLCGLLGVTTTKAQEKEEGQQKMTQEEIAKIMKWSPDSYNSIKAGEPFPDYVFTDIEGKKVKVSKFKGKYVVIDVWATWCTPCLASIADMEPKKAELMEKGVVFLYYTGETSKKENWDNMIPGISGEHYRVTAEQWKDLCGKFGIEGIPFYLIYNQKGELIHQGNSHSAELISKINSCF